MAYFVNKKGETVLMFLTLDEMGVYSLNTSVFLGDTLTGSAYITLGKEYIIAIEAYKERVKMQKVK